MIRRSLDDPLPRENRQDGELAGFARRMRSASAVLVGSIFLTRGYRRFRHIQTVRMCVTVFEPFRIVARLIGRLRTKSTLG